MDEIVNYNLSNESPFGSAFPKNNFFFFNFLQVEILGNTSNFYLSTL